MGRGPCWRWLLPTPLRHPTLDALDRTCHTQSTRMIWYIYVYIFSIVYEYDVHCLQVFDVPDFSHPAAAVLSILKLYGS